MPRQMIKSLLYNLRYPVAAIFAIIAGGCRDEAGSVDFVQHRPGPVAQSVSTVAFADEEAVDERPAEDRPNRMAKQAFLKASTGRAPIELESLLVPVKAVKKGSTIKSEPPLLPLRHTRTKLVEFESAPFPYHGVNPNTGRPFLDVSDGGRRGHRGDIAAHGTVRPPFSSRGRRVSTQSDRRR